MKSASRTTRLVAACLASLPATAGSIGSGGAGQASIFKAAGFNQAANGQYIRCAEEIPTVSYVPGDIRLQDLNGDGVPEAWVTESSLFCYGNTGQFFVLVTEDGGGWHSVLEGAGIPRVMETGYRGWPDIEVGGPGFAKFPVYRWNGKSYDPHN